jgi:hypothetical protein
MIVNLDLDNRTCQLIKEQSDPRCSGVVGGKGESKLL